MHDNQIARIHEVSEFIETSYKLTCLSDEWINHKNQLTYYLKEVGYIRSANKINYILAMSTDVRIQPLLCSSSKFLIKSSAEGD